VRRSPVHFQSPVHPLLGLAPLQSFHRTPSASLALRPLSRTPDSNGRLPSLGFPPSSRHPRCASTYRGASQAPLRSALRVSHSLDGFLRAALLRPCFMPKPRTGFHLQGVCSPPNDRADSRRPGPPRRFLLPSLWKPKSPCQSDRPRPRGRAPSGDASACHRCYPVTGCAPLMVFCLSRALPPVASVTRFPERVLAMRFADSSFTLFPPAALRGLTLRRARFDSLEPPGPPEVSHLFRHPLFQAAPFRWR